MNQISLQSKKDNPIKRIIFLFILVILSLFFSKVSAAPIITAPTSSSGLTQTSETFSWAANGTANITQWWLYIGNTGAGSRNIFNANQNTNTTTLVNGLPGNGSNLNVRLWYRINAGFWQYDDFICSANNGCTFVQPAIVNITNPIDGSTLLQPSQIFNWQLVSGTVTQYWLYIGNTGVGSNNILNASQGLNTQATVNNLPTDGSTVYVRLWFLEGGWKFTDFSYTSCSGCVISPIITLKKTSAVISDGINNAINSKRIPGAIIEYTITATNSGFGTADPNSIVINDSIPSDTDYEAGTLQFLNNTSGLNAIATLNDTGGNIQVTPQGTFLPSSGAGDPSFQVKFQVKVK